ncbi:MAG: ABC transporter permease [Phycisphaerales bacterium]
MTALPGNLDLPESVSGIQLAQGVGAQPAKGFWADAWSQVLRRRAAVLSLAWLGIIAFFAVFSPILASGHPLILRELTPEGQTRYPLFRFLSAIDATLLLAVGVALPILWFAGGAAGRAARMRAFVVGLILALAITLPVSLAESVLGGRYPPERLVWIATRTFGGVTVGPAIITAASALIIGTLAMVFPFGGPLVRRLPVIAVAALVGATVCTATWGRPFERFEYIRAELAGEASATYTAIPWSPSQRFSELSRMPPGSRLGPLLELPPAAAPASRPFVMGTDAFGADVMTQVLHACRLSISIGVVSTGIALLIGVTMGALMGYFGGWVDLLLYRVVEIFMAVPVLFLLVVAVSVLPNEMRSTYMMMAIIGCFTWTGMARFTRAEFLKLRNQDFVQSARAVGLPLRSVLFKHMLPNGVAPVLVDTSFAIAAAITIEAILSYLGLGPIDQASWGKLLASAVTTEGEFKWWLAVFPGIAIFLTVLSYNLIGESLRDAIDPRLKKARV